MLTRIANFESIGGHPLRERPVIGVGARQADSSILDSGWLRAIDAAFSPITSGFEAEFIGSAQFVLKKDSRRRELVDEARKVIVFSNDPALPKEFREAWPKIYHVEASPPFAYLMEKLDRADGWLPVADALFERGQNRSQRDLGRGAVLAGLSVLSTGYSSGLERGLRIDPLTDYAGRIVERMERAAELDSHFSSRQLIANGVRYRPWQKYIEQIRSNAALVSALAPDFVGPVHGDPNLTNIFARVSVNAPQIKFIDPKPRRLGDYIYDIAKVSHFLDVTGPLEISAKEINLQIQIDFDQLSIDYVLQRPRFVRPLLANCWASAFSLATQLGDDHWEARYELAVAAALLGLPSLRLSRGEDLKLQRSLVFYCEGMKWLKKFCRRLELPK